MNKENANSMYTRTSDDSIYSDEDPRPHRITRPKRRTAKDDSAVCSPRLQAISEPANATFQHLYHRYGYIMEPQRALRIRRKLDDINLMTLEQLEAEINERTKDAKEKYRQEKQARGKSFKEFSEKMIDQLFEVFATQFNKQIEKRQKNPICVTEATNRLIEYCQEIVENAVPKNCPRKCRGSISFRNSEETAKQLVAQVLALVSKRIFMDNAKLSNC